jgi:phage tail sheath protein FI
MASFVSPGVYVIEKDLSDYPVALNPSVVGIVGFANQGPINKATLITSQEGLIQKFGNPSENITGQALEGSIEILEATNSMYFIRCSDSGSAKDASSTVKIGSCPAFEVSAQGYGTTENLYLDVQVNIDGANFYPTAKQFNIPAGTSIGSASAQAYAIKSVIGGSLDGAGVGAYFDDTTAGKTKGWVTAGYAGSSIILTASAYSSVDRTAGVLVSALMPVNASGGSDTAAGGEGYETISISGVDILSTGIDISINKDGAAEESFRMSLTASGDFAEDVLNTGSTDLKSQFVKGFFIYQGSDAGVTPLTNFQDQLSSNFIGSPILGGPTPVGDVEAAVNPRFCKFKEGTYSLAGGDNGNETATELIGAASDKTGIYALDDDTLNISMGAVPGIATQTVQNTLITLAETSQNFLAVVAPPEGLTSVQQAIDWSNGQSDERTAAIASNYAAIYWPWVKTFDVVAQKDRYYDPSIFAIRQMAYTDDVGEPWFAPAGVIRGRLTKPTEVEVSVNQGDRDSMYSGGNVVNPIVNFPQQGIMIFGQRTAQRNPTALDRVNVRRLLIIIRKQLLASTRRFVFEPNDATTWEKVINVVDPLLGDILRRRGLVDYKVVCDETTNTSVRVDRNELWCKVLLKPTKTAEIVVFELNLTNQSATL